MKFKFYVTLGLIGLLILSASASDGKLATLSPYVNLESTFYTSEEKINDDYEYYATEFYNTNMLSLGLNARRSIFFASVSGVLPWYKAEFVRMALDANLGVSYNDYFLYAGKFTDFKSEDDHEMVSPYYAGVGKRLKINDYDVTLSGQYQFGEYLEHGTDEWNQRYCRTEDYNNISVSAKVSTEYKNIYPYIKFTAEKWNLMEDIDAMVSVGVSLFSQSYGSVESPKNISFPGAYMHVVKKPAIYLYPEENETIDVKVYPDGHLTKTIPYYGNGWNVSVTPESRIDNTYNYLFYEADIRYFELPEKGWCVPTYQLNQFFDKTLPKYNLSSQEIADFREYWISKLSDYNKKYMIIYPLVNSQLDVICPVNINPQPDSFRRLWFAFTPTDQKEHLEEPSIPVFRRIGFTAVEWGGLIVE